MMSKSKWEESVSSSPLFRGYCRAVSEEFRFLVTDLGFQPSEPEILNYEWRTDYRNETTRVTPFYEIGSLPTVFLYRLKFVKDRVLEAGHFDINFLIAARCPERRLTGLQPVPFSDEDFTPIYRHYAGVLMDFAADVLRGDFSILPKIRKLAERESRKRYREDRKKRDAR